MKTWIDFQREMPTVPARVEAPRRPTDDMDVEQLTEAALEAQAEADLAQRKADKLRSALYLRRKQRIGAGEPVPEAPTGLPGWSSQAVSEDINRSNAEIDADARRRGVR